MVSSSLRARAGKAPNYGRDGEARKLDLDYINNRGGRIHSGGQWFANVWLSDAAFDSEPTTTPSCAPL